MERVQLSAVLMLRRGILEVPLFFTFCGTISFSRSHLCTSTSFETIIEQNPTSDVFWKCDECHPHMDSRFAYKQHYEAHIYKYHPDIVPPSAGAEVSANDGKKEYLSSLQLMQSKTMSSNRINTMYATTHILSMEDKTPLASTMEKSFVRMCTSSTHPLEIMRRIWRSIRSI